MNRENNGMAEDSAGTHGRGRQPMNRDDAQKLDGRIRRMAKESKRHLDTLATLVDQAKAGRIHDYSAVPK